MRIGKITAEKERIVLHTDEDGAVQVTETVATVGPKPSRILSVTDTKAVDGCIVLSRWGDGNDRIYSRFSVTCGGEKVAGVCYVTDIADDVPENTSEYPQPATIKTLGAPPMLAKKLQLQQSRWDINLCEMMSTVETEDTEPYEFNGKTYYILRSAVESIDRRMSTAPLCTMILLNSFKSFHATGEKALEEKVIHPGFDRDFPNAFLSAFNMQEEEGLNYYGAFVEFLAERYSRPDGKYGHAGGAIISNEINTQYIWGNAGEMTAEEYMREYTQAMRLAWICGRKHCSHFRVYISLDHFWTGVNPSAKAPLQAYPGRQMVELLRAYTAEEGDFDWGIAHHPYPEDLRYPDFWNDRWPEWNLDTPKITFKNIEVLDAFLSQKEYLYRGKLRRVLFSEQGFNSRNGPLQELTEKQAEAAYVLAYLKARKMKTVDMMTHHGCTDSPGEFGLNLGLFRYDPDAPERVGEPKPVFASFLAMDTPEEAAAVEKARAFIGAELFDFILNQTVDVDEPGHENVLGNA